MIWLIVLMPFFLIGIVLLLIYLLSKQMLYFKPIEGKAQISKAALLGKLMKLDKNVFEVKKLPGYDFTIEWTISDAKWLGIIGKNWENFTYSAKAQLDEDTKTVLYKESLTRSRKVTGMEGLRTYSYSSRGPQLYNKISQKRYSIKPDGTVGEVQKFEFSPNEIKSVIKQVVTENGWGLKLVFLLKAKG
jgi:hypothetical protein